MCRFAARRLLCVIGRKKPTLSMTTPATCRFGRQRQRDRHRRQLDNRADCGRRSLLRLASSEGLLTHILAIDPGLRATGYAYFRKGHLVRAGLKQCKLVERGEIAAFIGRDLAIEFVNQPLDALIVEVPQVYQSRLMKGDPNDLVSVALVAGAVFQVPARVRRAVSPHQW